MLVIQWLLGAGIIAALVLTAWFSIRYRREADPRRRGLNNARMNISMGTMLVLMALVQMLVFSGSTVRLIIGAVFLVLGLFNLFAGLRNHSFYNASR
ncbi:YtpI family protein [Paenibacillus sp. IB182496]|uniref:YtpI family protein n=1 Tax=Paenibacillus sabuli TaxID=2772509 RepID=A0A927GU39_9BACL|nr:YtpI family protein [Paenibacillus sabuli]MBD2848268.1 YtpI family protein [Paenibacillus sabuli]